MYYYRPNYRFASHKGRPVTIAVLFKAEDVWGAAAAAQRINGEYLKGDKFDPQDTSKVIARANRSIVHDFLQTPALISDEDKAAGAEVRRYYHSFSFKLLSDAFISDFDRSAIKIAEKEELSSNLDIAIVASLPSCAERGRARDANQSRIKFAQGGFIGKVGDKVTADIEVLKCVFSHNWNVFFVTGITSDDKALFFSFKEKVEIGAKMTIKGTVKAHRDDSTQLTRVKVL